MPTYRSGMVNKPPMVMTWGWFMALGLSHYLQKNNDTNGGNNNTNDHTCKQTPAIQHYNKYNYDDCDIS